MMIDASTIDRILNSAQIVDVIQDYVSLKRRGVNYIGLCPFHDEKTPSFTVSQSKGIYKCFGCGKGGNAVNFLMDIEHFSYPDALKYLAKKYHIEIIEKELSEKEIKEKGERESLNLINEFAADYFSNILFNTVEGKSVGYSYFKERGFDDEIIKTFRLGYCLEDKQSFTKKALSSGYKPEFLAKLGLSFFKENYYSDTYFARVIFPIFSLSGQVIGFGGRSLRTDKQVAKYINSPESQVYNKSHVLYGMFQAKNEIVKQGKCYLVEGYTDVISLHLAGIKNVVASSGTSLTIEQIKLIHRFTDNITLLYDGDMAGIKAAIRAIDMIIDEGVNVRIVKFLPTEDPDSYMREYGKEKLLDFISQNEQDFINFKTSLISQAAINDPIEKTRHISSLINTIALIEDAIKQTVYIKESSKLLKIEESLLFSEVLKKRRQLILEKKQKVISSISSGFNAIRSTPTVPHFVDNTFYELQEEEIIRLLLLYGNVLLSDVASNEITVADYIINQLRDDELEMKNLINKKIFKLAEIQRKEGNEIILTNFTNNRDPDISKLSAKICISTHSLSQIWKRRGLPIVAEEDNLSVILEDVFIKYKMNIILEALRKIKIELEEAEKNNNQELIEDITRKIQKLTEIRTKLSEMQGRVII